MYEGWISADGAVSNVNAVSSRNGTEYSVAFTYRVKGEWFGGTFTTSEAYHPGDALSLRYDPAKPERNDLVAKEKVGTWAIALVVVFVGLVAVYMLFFR